MRRTRSVFFSLRPIGCCVVLFLISTQSWGQRACPPSLDFNEGLGSEFGRTGSRWTNCVGTYTLPDGSKYVGEFQFGQFWGQGTYTFPDGSKYVGEFKDGDFSGQGTYTAVDGSKYVGAFIHDQRFGQGTFTYTNGDQYVGEFRRDSSHGQGTLTYVGGAEYVGEFEKGLHHGQGTLTMSDGSKYVGEFRENGITGRGTYTAVDGSVQKDLPSNWVMWANATLQRLQAQGCSGNYDPATWTDCVGAITLAEGRRYEGEFRDGEPNGQGTYNIADGEKYVGTFKDGTFNGQGTLTRADGSKYVGEFKNQRFNGQGTLTRADGSIQTGLWENGTLLRPEIQPQENSTLLSPVEVSARQNPVNTQRSTGTLTRVDGSVQTGLRENNEFLEPQERVTENQTSNSGRFDVFNQTRQSAEEGDATAQYNLGQMYRGGEGVPQNYVNAHAWWNVSSAFGHGEASESRSTVEELMTPSQISEAQQLSTEIYERIRGNL